MLQDNNLYGGKREFFGSPLPCTLAAGEQLEIDHAPRTGGRPIDIRLDLSNQEIEETIERYVGAFGENYVKAEQSSDGAAVLRLYPGGAKELLR